MIQKLTTAVAAFHEKMGIAPKCAFPEGHSMSINDPAVNRQLHYACLQLKAAADLCEGVLDLPNEPDPRYLRLHLACEEMAEYIDAMLMGNPVNVLDALSDMMYVHAGDAVVFDWNLPEAVSRVHLSNMTKQPKSGPRLRDKGAAFIPVALKDLV